MVIHVIAYVLGVASGISLWHFAGPSICSALRLHVLTRFRIPKAFR